MAGGVHIKLECQECKKKLNKGDPTFSVTKKEGRFIIYKAVCRTCKEHTYTK